MKDLIITCRTTCGCGNELVPYTNQTETTHYLLTCKAFSNLYDHPLLIAIDKKSPIFIKAEKWDKRDFDRTNMLTESNTKYRQENKKLKERLRKSNEQFGELATKAELLKQKLEKMKEFRQVIDKGRHNNELYDTDLHYRCTIDTILNEFNKILGYSKK